METPKVAPAASADSKLHFLDYWRIIRIRKVIILAVFLLVMITVTAVTFVMQEFYSSTARIRVEKDTPDIALWGMSGGVQPYDPYYLTTEFEVLKSSTILYPVIDKLRLQRVFRDRFKAPSDYTMQQAAEVLGIPVDRIHPTVVDTDTIGFTGVTGGSRTTFATGWAAGRKTDPWYAAGRNPLPKFSRPPGGISPPFRTTKPGRFWFSLPSP